MTKQKQSQPSARSLQEMPELTAAQFRHAVRGKYYRRARQEFVLLAPDVRKVFPDSDSVNQALRAVIDLQRFWGKHRGTARR
jgi:hypothetical protein